jgi:hypothetical protein
MKPEGKRTRLLLGGLRLATAGSFVAPRLAARAFAVEASPQSAYLVRLFAARNVALAAGLWISPAPARRLWWQTGIACDALDVGAALLALREGKPRSAALADAAAALVATGLGVAGLLAERGGAR